MPLNGTPENSLLQETGSQDQGFAPFRLVPSNFKPWPGADKSKPKEYARTMELFADPLVDGWKSESVSHPAASREGFRLTDLRKRLSGVKGTALWRVTDADKGQSFRICLDDELKPAAVARNSRSALSTALRAALARGRNWPRRAAWRGR